jgi:calcium permeable stress-gated cation channel
MIGIFGINQAPGPTVLMAIFLVFSILFHISLKNAVAPLLDTLPKSLEIEEEHLIGLEKGEVNGNGHEGVEKNVTDDGPSGTTLPPPHKKPNLFTKWLRPDVYTDYETMRRLVHRDFADITYSEEVERNAYYDPAVTSELPLLWIPRDPLGISRQEVAHTSKVLPITDEGATIDENGKIHWDPESTPPIHEEKIYY